MEPSLLQFQQLSGPPPSSGMTGAEADHPQYQFPKPTIGYICQSCRNIPAEFFLLGSSLVEDACEGIHSPRWRGCDIRTKHQLTCNGCQVAIAESKPYYHCVFCKDGDFDLCLECHTAGRSCLVAGHVLRRRQLVEGKVHSYRRAINSTLPLEPGKEKAMNGPREALEALGRSLKPYQLHASQTALWASAKAGCHSCSIITSRMILDSGKLSTPMTKEGKDEGSVYLEASMSPYSCDPPDYGDVASQLQDAISSHTVLDHDNNHNIEDEETRLPFILVTCGPDNGPRKKISQLLYEVKGVYGRFWSRGSMWQGRDEPSQISPVVDAGDNLKIVKFWIETCKQCHSACSSHQEQQPFIPTRLIDVGSTKDEGPIRLICTNEGERVDAMSEYVALSYCWGTLQAQPIWSTTKKKLAIHRDAIPVDTLPKTISDAVSLVQTLGFRYLWVDSICIIQDDSDDWQREAKRMAELYRFSTLTIISGTDSATGGLFSPRNQLRVSAATLDPPSASGETGYQTVTLYPHIPNQGQLWESLPTSQRAWCYQEEMLSPRKLYFTSGQFTWICNVARLEETGVDGPGDVTHTGATIFGSARLHTILGAPAIPGIWYKIIREFTTRRLTYATDTFCALGGIARVFKESYRCGYVAGIWENDIPTGLLWQRVGELVGGPTEFTVPSWSWLSVKGTVMFNRGVHNQITAYNGKVRALADVVGFEVPTIDGDEFNQVNGGYLRLQASLIACTTSQIIDGGEEQKVWNTMSTSDIMGRRRRGMWRDTEDRFDESLRNTLPGGRLDMTAVLEVQRHQDPPLAFATVYFDREEDVETKSLVCALISQSQAREDDAEFTDSDDDTNYVDVCRNGLALVQVKNQDGLPTYRRIGFVAFWDKLITDDLSYIILAVKTEFILV